MFRILFALVLACSSVAAPPVIHFEWATPLPHRQTWMGLAAGNGRVVGITDGWGGRSVYTTRDGRTWTQPTAAPKAHLYDIQFAEGEFIAVGNYDAIFTSPDGETWTTHPTGLPLSSFNSVARGNGAVVAVGYYGTAMVSTNLDRWMSITNFKSHEPIEVAFGNGRFVVVAQNLIWTSPDGFNWQEQTGPTPFSRYFGITFSNGIFAMFVDDSEYGLTYVSTDGVHWGRTTSAGFALSASETGFFGITLRYGPNTPIASGLYQSRDAVNWQKMLAYDGSQAGFLTCVAQLNGTYIGGGYRGLLVVSTNGRDWETLVKPVKYSRERLAFGGGEFLLYNDAGISTSTDGAQWMAVPNAPILCHATFGDGIWVGAATNGTFARSPDARSWTTVDAGFPAKQIHFGNGLFLAQPTADSPSDILRSIAISRDGVSWRRIPFEGTRGVGILGNLNGRWAGSIDGQRPITSEDGQNWTIHPADSNMFGGLIAVGNDRFLTFGAAGMGPGRASWSFDGIHWQTVRPGSSTTHIESSMTFGNGIFLLTDNGGNVFTSTDGTNWVGHREIEDQSFNSAAYGNGRWLLAGGDSLIRSVPTAASSATLQIQSNFSQWFLMMNAGSNEILEIQSAPDPKGPWTFFSNMSVGDRGRSALGINVSDGSQFFRAVATQR